MTLTEINVPINKSTLNPLMGHFEYKLFKWLSNPFSKFKFKFSTGIIFLLADS